LIPTPGQTEQEYLSKYLMKNNFALCVSQNKFILKNALNLSENFNYKLVGFDDPLRLESVVDRFIYEINTGKNAI